MRKLFMLSMALIALVPMVKGAGQEKRATQAAQPEAGETVVLGRQVMKRSSEHGVSVNDLLLDLETAHVALLVIQWKHSDQGDSYRAVLPWSDALPQEGLDSSFWKSLSTVPPQGVNRAFAGSVYSSAKRDIYWSQKLAAQPAEFDRESFQLSAYANLVGQAVADKQQKSLGKITDVGINDTTGEIVYFVLTSGEGEHRAIPLGAFTVRPKSVPWAIDLDREQVLAFETCELEPAPQSVARGWQEFVAVKYGRNAVQTTDADEKRKQQ